MAKNTRTATVSSGITEDFQTVSSLIDDGTYTGDSFNYEDILFENTGDKNLIFASMANGDTPTDATGKTLAPGDILPLRRANLSLTHVKTADDSGTNAFEFVGTPKE